MFSLFTNGFRKKPNGHLLTLLAEQVRILGCLRNSWTFPNEGMIGQFRRIKNVNHKDDAFAFLMRFLLEATVEGMTRPNESDSDSDCWFVDSDSEWHFNIAPNINMGMVVRSPLNTFGKIISFDSEERLVTVQVCSNARYFNGRSYVVVELPTNPVHSVLSINELRLFYGHWIVRNGATLGYAVEALLK